jgi:hypothetical protein
LIGRRRHTTSQRKHTQTKSFIHAAALLFDFLILELFKVGYNCRLPLALRSTSLAAKWPVGRRFIFMTPVASNERESGTPVMHARTSHIVLHLGRAAFYLLRSVVTRPRPSSKAHHLLKICSEALVPRRAVSYLRRLGCHAGFIDAGVKNSGADFRPSVFEVRLMPLRDLKNETEQRSKDNQIASDYLSLRTNPI